MISYLSGQIKNINKDSLIVYLENIGIGYSVFVKDSNLYKKDNKIELYIYYHWNQDNGPRLFGFNSQEEKQIFELVLSCSGLGPKVGLSVLASLTPEQFINAITFADISTLNKINGIGKKKAEFMAMQLKDKVSNIILDNSSSISSLYFSNINKLSEALGSLSYSKKEVDQAIGHIKNNCELEKVSFDLMLRKALSFLSKRI